MRDSIKSYVEKTKRLYHEGNISEALKTWNCIYDEFGDITLKNVLEWREAMSQFSDEEVYRLTDYYKYSIGYY